MLSILHTLVGGGGGGALSSTNNEHEILFHNSMSARAHHKFGASITLREDRERKFWASTETHFIKNGDINCVSSCLEEFTAYLDAGRIRSGSFTQDTRDEGARENGYH